VRHFAVNRITLSMADGSKNPTNSSPILIGKIRFQSEVGKALLAFAKKYAEALQQAATRGHSALEAGAPTLRQ